MPSTSVATRRRYSRSAPYYRYTSDEMGGILWFWKWRRPARRPTPYHLVPICRACGTYELPLHRAFEQTEEGTSYRIQCGRCRQTYEFDRSPEQLQADVVDEIRRRVWSGAYYSIVEATS